MVTPVLQARAPARSSHRYEFVESHELTSLNLSRSLASVCCAVGKWKQQYSSRNVVTPISHGDSRLGSRGSTVSKSKLVMESGLYLGLMLIIAVHVCPAAYGGPMAVVATAVSLPSILAAMSIVRYDVVVLLLKSYEFWYFVGVNSVTSGLIGAYFNDVRAIVTAVLWVGILNTSLVDAKTLEVRQSIAVNAGGAVTSFVMLALVQWGRVPAARHFAILHYRDHVLSVEDIIVNGLATISIMMARNAFRRAQDLRQQKRMQCTLLRCVSYRCTIKLRLLDEVEGAQSVVSGTCDHSPNYQKKKHVLNEMIYVDTGAVYDASQTFYPVELNGEMWPKWQRILLVAIVVAGIALTILGFAAAGVLSPSQTRWLFAGGLAFTECFGILMWCMSQTRVLREILLSFDFFFLSSQLTCAHLCACDMFQWDARSLGMLSSWLWIHFVLTADALTPVVRKKIALQAWYLGLLVLLFLAAQSLLACEIVFGNRWALQDRKIHAIAVGDRIIEYRVITFFFSRFATIFLWCLRLLWRIAVSGADDLIMLRGKVAYAYLNDSAAVGSDVSEREHHRAGSELATKQPKPATFAGKTRGK